jgi:UDP-galactose transporter B1
MSSRDGVTVAICAAGIFLCYAYYGILQEKIVRGTYGTQGDRFNFITSLLFLQCLVSVVVSRTMLLVRQEPVKDVFRGGVWPVLSLAYLGAMVCSNQALHYLNYPTQVVGKSCKPIPIMIIGVLFAGRSYTWRKYLFVLMIVLGVAVFSYKDKKADITGSSFGFGEMLLVASLALDGVTAAIQDTIKSNNPPSSYQMMFCMNIWSTLAALLASLLTGDLNALVAFLVQYPDTTANVGMFCACSALGQVFIYKSVTQLSPLTCSIITTTRKCFTVVASVLLFGNQLSTRQWTGVLVVFAGLFLDANFGRTPSPRVPEVPKIAKAK